jgi:hypothetical protein
MKAIILFLEISILIVMYSCKSTEETKQSHETMDDPNWIKAIEPGFLVGEGFGWTYSQAKDSAMENIRIQISKEIAYSCVQLDQVTVINNVVNGGVYSKESFIRQCQSQTYSSILSGISIQKATKYFFKVHCFPEGQIIHYFIQYPYSTEDLTKDIEEWEKTFNQFTNRLKDVISNKKVYSTIDDMISDIRFFQQNQLLYNDQVQTQVETALSQLYSMISNISIQFKQENNGALQIRLMQNANPIIFSRSPKVISKCLVIKNVENMGSYWRIHFNENTVLCNRGKAEVEVEFDVSPASPVFSSYIVNPADTRLNLSVSDPISISIVNRSLDKANIVLFYLRLTSANNTPFKVMQMEFIATRYYRSFWAGTIASDKLAPVIIPEINKECNGKGIFHLNFECNCTLDIAAYSSVSINPTISGKIYVQSLFTGEQYQIEFKDINLITNW